MKYIEVNDDSFSGDLDRALKSFTNVALELFP